MSINLLQDLAVHHDNLNIRCNNLTVDGTFNHSGSGDFWSEVSTFAELQTSLSSGNTRIAIIANIVATSNVTLLPNNEYLIFIDASLDMGDHQIIVNGSNTVFFEGKGYYTNNVAIQSEPTTSHPLFSGDTASTIITFSNCGIYKTSAQANTPLCVNANLRFFNSGLGCSAVTANNGFTLLDKSCVAVNSDFSNCSVTVSQTILISGCTFTLGTLTLVNSTGPRLIGCFFDDSTVNLNNTNTDVVISGCYKTAGATVNNTSVTPRVAANNF